MTTEETRALVLQTLQDAGATGDLAAAIRRHANPALVVHLSNGETGGIEFAANNAQELFTGFPDASLTMEGMVVENDRAMIQFVLGGTHTGPIRGFAPTGRVVSIPVCIAFRVDQSSIVELWFYANPFAPLVATYAESHPDQAL